MQTDPDSFVLAAAIEIVFYTEYLNEHLSCQSSSVAARH